MNKVNDTNLQQDLAPLFVDKRFIDDWLAHWRESYLRLLDAYKIRTVTALQSIRIHQDFRTDIYTFAYVYGTDDGGTVRIIYSISDHWVDFREGDLSIAVEKTIESNLAFAADGSTSKASNREKLWQYATLFYYKSETYLSKVSRILLGDGMGDEAHPHDQQKKLNQREHARVDNLFDREYWVTARGTNDQANYITGAYDNVYNAEDLSIVVAKPRFWSAGVSATF